MSMFKRVSATVSARLERWVGEFENHDAVVEATLEEMRRALARARVYRTRVQRDGERLAQQLAAARDEERAWGERARRSADDEATALECLRRRRQCRERIAQLEHSLTDHAAAEQKLDAEVRRAERRLERLSTERNLMRSRESAVEAVNAAHRTDPAADVDAAFERWAVRLAEAELAAGGEAGAGDPLRDRFAADEELDALREELAQLRQEGRGDD